jgi:hypothetical protein
VSIRPRPIMGITAEFIVGCIGVLIAVATTTATTKANRKMGGTKIPPKVCASAWTSEGG